MAGLSFIPLVIGLFAIPEILKAVAGGGGAASVRMAVGASRVTWAEFRRCFKSIMRGSLIGVVMGAIPGIGGAPAAYLSYSEAKRYSPRRENFGKGELEGVAAAESGNNGVCGATLIPLLSLGVPGDIVTAVMLGAFMMHNITPGPLLFQDVYKRQLLVVRVSTPLHPRRCSRLLSPASTEVIVSGAGKRPTVGLPALLLIRPRALPHPPPSFPPM